MQQHVLDDLNLPTASFTSPLLFPPNSKIYYLSFSHLNLTIIVTSLLLHFFLKYAGTHNSLFPHAFCYTYLDFLIPLLCSWPYIVSFSPPFLLLPPLLPLSTIIFLRMTDLLFHKTLLSLSPIFLFFYLAVLLSSYLSCIRKAFPYSPTISFQTPQYSSACLYS